jgi:hypothetical protein
MTRALLFAAASIACAGGSQPAPSQPAQAQPVPAAVAPRPDVKAPGNLSVRTRSEAVAEAEAHLACIDGCLADRSTDGRPIDALQAECQGLCDARAPIRQVEIVPDDLPAPPGAP